MCGFNISYNKPRIENVQDLAKTQSGAMLKHLASISEISIHVIPHRLCNFPVDLHSYSYTIAFSYQGIHPSSMNDMMMPVVMKQIDHFPEIDQDGYAYSLSSYVKEILHAGLVWLNSPSKLADVQLKRIMFEELLVQTDLNTDGDLQWRDTQTFRGFLEN